MSRSIQHETGPRPGEPAEPAPRDGAPTGARARLGGLIRPLTLPQLVVDLALAAVFALLLGPLSLLMLTAGTSLAVAIAVTALMTVALAIARLSPALALLLAWIGALVQMGFGAPPLPVNLAILGVLYATAAYGSRLLVRLGLVSALFGAGAVAVYLVAVAGLAPAGGAFSWDLFLVGASTYIASAVTFVLAWTVGLLVRTAQRARRTRLAQAAAEREMLVEQERGRIARDMHDVVAHSLAVVIAQADGARYAAQHDPDAGSAALETIAGTARAALADVRMLLTQLRHSQAAGPQPTIADLEQLYAQVRAAGAAVHVEVAPTPPGIPPAAVQIAVYRILQEALTNALRHGTGGEVWVRLAWHADRIDLEVRNASRPAAAPPRAGHGLVGMGERAALVGGTLSAAPRGEQFVVAATLPIGAPA